MNRTLIGRISGAALIPVLGFALASSTAYAQDRDDHRYNQGDQRDNARDNHDHARGDDRDHGRDFHFDDNYRARFAQHYHGDADHWRNRRDRVHFARGERIPVGYSIRPVPRAYYTDVPPPPPGYQYGYYEGYVVAYNPTTRVVGDVLDIAAAAMNH